MLCFRCCGSFAALSLSLELEPLVSVDVVEVDGDGEEVVALARRPGCPI